MIGASAPAAMFERRRAGRPLSAVHQIAEDALSKWGQECRPGVDSGELSLPSRTLIARLIELGPDAASQAGAASQLTDASLAIDIIVGYLTQEHPLLAQTAHVWWRLRDRFNQKICAKALEISERTLQRRIGEIRQVVVSGLGLDAN